MRYAAVINRRHKSGNITDHSAAETNYRRLTIKSGGDHSVANRAGLLQCFGCFTCRNRDQNWVKTGDRQTLFCAIREKRCDIGVGNDDASCARTILARALAELLEQ